MCVWPLRSPKTLTQECPTFPPGAELLPDLAAPLGSTVLVLSPPPNKWFWGLLCCSHGYSKRVCCTSVLLWLHTVKLALSLVYLGIKNIWAVLWLNQSFLLGSVHETSLFLSFFFLHCAKAQQLLLINVLMPYLLFFFSFLIKNCSE